jgi:predicted Zn-dependent protease
MGALHASRREWDAAAAEYEAARAANPRLPMLNHLAGEALMRGRGDWSAAADAFRAEIAANPQHYESNLMLGTLLLEGGQLAEGLPLLERAARLRPDDPAVAYPLGAAYLSSGRLDEARSLLEAAAKASPAHVQARLKLAALYTKLGLTGEAERARAEVIRLQREAEARAMEGGRHVLEQTYDSEGSADAAADPVLSGTAGPPQPPAERPAAQATGE